MRPRSDLAPIFLISLAAILLEINYTRIFSFKLYYYFTYFIIGIALLGLGSGGVLVAISTRLRARDPDRVVAICCLCGSASVLLGYWIIALTPVSATELALRFTEVGKLALVTLALFVPFLAVGIAITTILGSRPAEVGRLYGADLVGAGLGCTLSLPLMATISPPSCVMLAGLILALSAWAAARERARLAEWGGLAAIYLAAALIPGAIPDVMTDVNKTLSRFQRASRTGLRFGTPAGALHGVWFSKWSPVFRVDVTLTNIEEKQALLLHHDGQLGSALHRFDGDLESVAHLAADPRALPFSVIAPDARVLIIGAAGGHEILASLYFGAREITGVELNPVTVSLLTEIYAGYAGNLADREEVTVINAEGRSFLKQTDVEYDLIWLVAPDSYAAMNAATSGAYVLSESYLYTVEMVLESLAHLAPGGVLCAQFGEFDYAEAPLRTTRYVATAREALNRAGIDDFRRHVFVSTASDMGAFTLSTVLLSAEAFRDAQIDDFLAAVKGSRDGVARYVVDRTRRDDPVTKVASLPDAELGDWLAAYPYDVSGISDDSPFFWHFARFRDVFRSPVQRAVVIDWEKSAGERVLLVLLSVSVAFAAAMLLLPFAFVGRSWRAMPRKLPATLYFAAIGAGFMLLEISLIQMFTLVLGYPTYSLSVTLFSLLIFSGVGSLLSARYLARRNRALAVLAVALLGLIAFFQLAMPLVVEPLMSARLGWRVASTVALIAPLGLCLGAFMPLGLATVAALGDHAREYVAWGWAVNGFSSVISSVLAAMLAMSFGFKLVLLIAAAIYLLAAASLLRIPAPSRVPAV